MTFKKFNVAFFALTLAAIFAQDINAGFPRNTVTGAALGGAFGGGRGAAIGAGVGAAVDISEAAAANRDYDYDYDQEPVAEEAFYDEDVYPGYGYGNGYYQEGYGYNERGSQRRAVLPGRNARMNRRAARRGY